MKIFVGLAVFLLSFSSSAFAARPLSTDDAGTIEKGHIEFEGGFEYVNNVDNEYNWSTTLKYGLRENWDFGVEIPYQALDVSEGDDVDGVADLVICSKYRLLDQSVNIVNLAINFKIKTKTGNNDKGLGAGDIDYSATAILTKELGNITSHINLGYTYVGGPEGTDNDSLFSYALALEYPLDNKCNLVGEFTGETNFEGDFNNNPFAGLIGCNYAVSEDIAVDLGLAWQISEASPDYKIISGVTLGF